MVYYLIVMISNVISYDKKEKILMKTKRIITSVIMLVLLCSLVACGGGNKNKLEGDMWYVSEKYIDDYLAIFPTSVPNDCMSNYDNCRVQFLSNGGIIVEAGNSDYSELTANLCTYSQVDDKLEIMAPLGSKSYADFEIKDGVLTITDQKGNKVVLTKEEHFQDGKKNPVMSEAVDTVEPGSEGIVNGADSEEFTHFDKSDEWSKYTKNDAVVQIDDTIYRLECTVKEIMDLVEASAADYNYEYVEGKLITSIKGDNIVIYRGDKEWFTIEAFNYTEETKPLSDLLVSGLELGEDCYEYCYFLDGISYQEIMEMTYNDVKEYGEKNLSDYAFHEGTSCMPKSFEAAICLSYATDTIYSDKMDWDFYQLIYGQKSSFYIDPNTSKVVAFELEY